MGELAGALVDPYSSLSFRRKLRRGIEGELLSSPGGLWRPEESLVMTGSSRRRIGGPAQVRRGFKSDRSR